MRIARNRNGTLLMRGTVADVVCGPSSVRQIRGSPPGLVLIEAAVASMRVRSVDQVGCGLRSWCSAGRVDGLDERGMIPSLDPRLIRAADRPVIRSAFGRAAANASRSGDSSTILAATLRRRRRSVVYSAKANSRILGMSCPTLKIS